MKSKYALSRRTVLRGMLGGSTVAVGLPLLEAMLDDNVGGAVEFMVERGGAEHVFRVAIESLHDLTPRTFLEAGGAVLHPLSFGQARNGHLRMESGVYLSYAGEQQGRPWQGNPAT